MRDLGTPCAVTACIVGVALGAAPAAADEGSGDDDVSVFGEVAALRTDVAPARGSLSSAKLGTGEAPADRSTATLLFDVGLYLTVAGAAGFFGGLVYTTAGPGEYCPNCPSSQYTAVGYAALIGGFATGVTGGALLVAGSGTDEPAETAASVAAPEVALGPGGATLRFTF